MNKEIYMYSYQDMKSDIYDVPFFAPDDVHAKRKFYLDVISGNGNHILGKFTEDFRLAKIGVVDLQNGKLKEISPEIIIEGVTLMNQIRAKEEDR